MRDIIKIFVAFIVVSGPLTAFFIVIGSFTLSVFFGMLTFLSSAALVIIAINAGIDRLADRADRSAA